MNSFFDDKKRKEIGQRIKQNREAAGLEQWQLAERVGYAHRQLITKLEAGSMGASMMPEGSGCADRHEPPPHVERASQARGGLPGQAFSQEVWVPALRLAGIANFHFHDLRHTFASDLVRRGVDLYRVMELMRHSTIEMTRRYAHLAPSDVAREVEEL